ncbi:transmembrane alanine and valine and leucinerich protein [Mycobacterium tuberculosis CAS/NITR204]|uniref:Transmembrane alanine and valine and leucinerich protein n=1 Tax=Mycobacterium tuberculosis CAS/NITR204 TaxID=1310114 RepID=R4MJ92_MYCTX|nr:transmembrane alanine and valine and leucinerich protein [Mycobacterium tuberculosis CAS/NITR204]
MSASLLVRTACGGRAVAQRLRTVLWPITQTSVVAGLAWYLTHDVFNHPQAFFAPISAVVCMSATNVLRARRAQQMIVGVALGIVLGAGVHALLGSGPIAMGVVVFIALSVAVLCARGLVAQGLMFINQAAVSAVLVLVFASNGSVVFERLFDALVGGGLAIVSSILLFPPDPVVMLCSARADVLAAVRDILAELVNTVSDPTSAPPDWPMAAADRLHQQLNGLIEVRANAAMVARRAPRRWGVRSTVRDLDQQGYLALLSIAVFSVAPLPGLVAISCQRPCTPCSPTSPREPAWPTRIRRQRTSTRPPPAQPRRHCNRLLVAATKWCAPISSKRVSPIYNG